MFKIIKHYSVHAFGLALSLTAIYHTMIQLSTDPIISQFFGIGGIFAGLSIQYLRGLSAAYRKAGMITKANLLWVPVILCIILFDFLSSFGILLSEVDKGDIQYTGIINKRAIIQEDINRVKADLEVKKRQQETEFNNGGRGRKYEAYQVEIYQLERRLELLRDELQALDAKTESATKSIFTLISEKSGIPSFWIEFAMFSGLMFLIYFVPLLTPWNVTLPMNISQAKPVTHKHNRLHSIETAVTKESSGTCICGAPAKPGCKYCGNPSCRVRASRAKKKDKKKTKKNAEMMAETADKEFKDEKILIGKTLP